MQRESVIQLKRKLTEKMADERKIISELAHSMSVGWDNLTNPN
jgi:hypothetical protein